MRLIITAITAVVVMLCGCGALFADPILGELIGIDDDTFANRPDDQGVGCGPQQCPPGSDWVKPVPHGVVSGYRTLDRPDHYGVDLGSPKGTPVVAATAGTVLTAECSAWLNGAFYGCDRDGSWRVSGCGWHVTIAHSGDAMTVYCHFNQKPAVTPGDVVDAGDRIGFTGSSGNSSGPHLHFEVHTNQVWDAGSSLDPVGFYAAKGLSL
ncbi:peptidase M23-like protein [Stackebrandtia endophytica]|uniref:Peptidase M23-like protein n=1 Tax=Stackebrandtia endophytica TaxID=1496996 RepID=A0A543AS41_9ACTN|nr:M23 family metallopeptidase [Stackebrandtia endophytica]TQL75366.1 peptidase M23-like protein [Stackebrandtia endophytica]